MKSLPDAVSIRLSVPVARLEIPAPLASDRSPPLRVRSPPAVTAEPCVSSPSAVSEMSSSAVIEALLALLIVPEAAAEISS